MKDMNREQELDQYEDHDTWLEMAKQDYFSFGRLLDEEQTDQQRKVCLTQCCHGSGNGQGKSSSRSGKSQEILFLVRKTWFNTIES